MKRLHCTQCGAKLKKDEEGDYFCEYCGNIYKSKREKGRVFVRDTFYKFDKDDTIRDVETVSQNSSAEFSYKKVKPLWTIISIILFIAVAFVIAAPIIDQGIEDSTPQTISYQVNGNGYLFIDGQKLKTYTCELAKGEEVYVGTIADTNYKFRYWSDGKTTSNRTDTKTGDDSVTYTAYFIEKTKYTLRYRAQNGGYIEGETEQTVYEYGSGSAVTAVASQGYYFTGWSDGVKSATRTDDIVTSSINVYAEFYSPFDSGSGTQDDPYLIANTEHFINMKTTAAGTYFRLKNNLNFENVRDLDWKGFDFSGNFDGNNFSVIGLKHSLFTSLSSAEVKNLVIDDANIYNSLYRNYYTGILANSVSGNVKITNCKITGSHIALSYSGANYIGLMIGVVKRDATVVVDGCTVESTSTSATIGMTSASVAPQTSFSLGGIAGYVENAASLEIKNTSVSGTLSVSSVTFDDTRFNTIYAGGLIGYTNYESIIKMSDNTISGKLHLVSINNYVYVAGLIGSSQTKDANITLGTNEISMNVPESSDDTIITYNETMN